MHDKSEGRHEVRSNMTGECSYCQARPAIRTVSALKHHGDAHPVDRTWLNIKKIKIRAIRDQSGIVGLMGAARAVSCLSRAKMRHRLRRDGDAADETANALLGSAL
jgi:hypothetical protein